MTHIKMYISAVVLAAGKGLRLKSDVSKPLLKIDSKPLIIYSLEALSRNYLIKEIIIVANQSNLRGIAAQIKRYNIGKVRDIVLGGRRRQDSVYKGLSAINPSVDLVLIHDGARPFIEKDKISALVRQAAEYGASILAVPVKATIKEVHSPQSTVHSKFVVKRTLDRERLWEVQTPQAFRKDLITEAYKKFKDSDVTDDASLVEKLGVRVNVVLGSYNNIKITTPEDLILAEAIAKRL